MVVRSVCVAAVSAAGGGGLRRGNRSQWSWRCCSSRMQPTVSCGERRRRCMVSSWAGVAVALWASGLRFRRVRCQLICLVRNLRLRNSPSTSLPFYRYSVYSLYVRNAEGSPRWMGSGTPVGQYPLVGGSRGAASVSRRALNGDLSTNVHLVQVHSSGLHIFEGRTRVANCRTPPSLLWPDWPLNLFVPHPPTTCTERGHRLRFHVRNVHS